MVVTSFSKKSSVDQSELEKYVMSQTYYMILWVHPILNALLCVAGCPIPIALVRIPGYPTPNGLTLYSRVF